jgi:hypothetical protein
MDQKKKEFREKVVTGSRMYMMGFGIDRSGNDVILLGGRRDRASS